LHKRRICLKDEAEQKFREDLHKKTAEKQHQMMAYRAFPLPTQVQFEEIMQLEGRGNSNSAKLQFATSVVRCGWQGLSLEEFKQSTAGRNTEEKLLVMKARALSLLAKISAEPHLLTVPAQPVSVNCSEIESVGELTTTAQTLLNSIAAAQASLINRLQELNSAYLPLIPMPWLKQTINVWPTNLAGFPNELRRDVTFTIENDGQRYICDGVTYDKKEERYMVYYHDCAAAVGEDITLDNVDVIKRTYTDLLQFTISSN
jgi:hypothetical protein